MTDASVCSVLPFRAPGRNADAHPVMDRPRADKSSPESAVSALLLNPGDELVRYVGPNVSR